MEEEIVAVEVAVDQSVGQRRVAESSQLIETDLALDPDLVEETISTILKHEGDVHKAQTELNKLLTQKAAEAQAQKPQPAPESAASVKKSVLH